MSLIHNERTKLTAAWLNTLATAVIAVGVFAPAAALIYGLTGPQVGANYLVVISVFCLLTGAGLHFIGRTILGRLRP